MWPLEAVSKLVGEHKCSPVSFETASQDSSLRSIAPPVGANLVIKASTNISEKIKRSLSELKFHRRFL
jgi:hypothetical protein